MFISILAFISAISISSVAAYYSVIGLTAIFPASWLSVVIMGSVLEVGKIVSALWLHSFWSKSSYLIRIYLSSAVIILMLITSLGIFGFLSKAHIDHMAGSGQIEISLKTFDEQIERQKKIISDNQVVLDQLDNTIKTLIDAQRIRGKDGSIAVRESQKEERENLLNNMDFAASKISELTKERSKVQNEQTKLESEVGPLKYVAELLYGENPDKSTLESAVRVLIILIVVVFDPLAVCLIIAAISGFRLLSKTKPQVISETSKTVPSYVSEQKVNVEEHTENQPEITPEELSEIRKRTWLGG